MTVTVITRAKTEKGIARAYIRQHGLPAPSEWSAGGGGSKRDICAFKTSEGPYRLSAVSVFNGEPAGVIFGPTFLLQETRRSNAQKS